MAAKLQHAGRARRRRYLLEGDLIFSRAFSHPLIRGAPTDHRWSYDPTHQDGINRRPNLVGDQVCLSRAEVDPRVIEAQLARQGIADTVGKVDWSLYSEGAITAFEAFDDRPLKAKPMGDCPAIDTAISVVAGEQVEQGSDPFP